MIKSQKTITYLCLLILLIPTLLHAQVFRTKNYPQGYFRNPLNIPITMAGNFGELRPNHYHMGLDIKTDQRENLPVQAAADGYVARIKIEPAGFGRAIYINHPNGYTTVYCHLNDFNPQLESWLEQQQYKQESWRVMVDVPKGLFPVKKGDFIGYSGNTGGSQGPHLHFEIRRTDDDVNLNPILFGFPIADNTAPVLQRLAIYNRNQSTYEQSPRMIAIKKTGSVYTTTPATIQVSASKISFAIGGYDTQSGATNQNGIYEAAIYNNGTPIVGFQMDEISYNDTRYLNAHIDYKTKANGGSYLQHLSELPGYIHSIYSKVNGDGVIDLHDKAVHAIKIVVKDGYGNASTIETNVQWDGSAQPVVSNTAKMFYPMMLDVFESSDCEFYPGEHSLYDSVHIAYKRSAATAATAVSAIHTIGATYIPLQEEMVVRIKTSRSLSNDERKHTVMQRFAGTKKEVEAISWQGDWASAKFRDFGSFQLVVDNESPTINITGFSDGAKLTAASRLVITPADNMSSVKNFRAELDGKWLRFTNDKGRSYIYRMDAHFPTGTHTLKITVEDEAGNATTRSYTLSR